MTILDHVAHRAEQAGYSRFRPTSTSEHFALRLAQKLGDGEAARHYVDLLTRYPEDRLLSIFRSVADVPEAERAKAFHREIERLPDHINGNGNGSFSRMGAIRVERRSVVVFVLSGYYPEHIQARQLSSVSVKALSSALGFVNRIFEQFPFQSAAIETIPNGHEIQRGLLTQAIIQTLRERDVTIWEVSKHEVFEALGYPALRSRKEVREVISTIWPFMNGGYGAAFVRDAAARGIYCQTERRFIH